MKKALCFLLVLLLTFPCSVLAAEAESAGESAAEAEAAGDPAVSQETSEAPEPPASPAADSGDVEDPLNEESAGQPEGAAAKEETLEEESAEQTEDAAKEEALGGESAGQPEDAAAKEETLEEESAGQPEDAAAVEDPLVLIKVPESGKLIINPYGYPVQTNKGVVTDQIVSSTQYLVSKSNVPISTAVQVDGLHSDPEVRLVSGEPDPTAKDLFLYVEFQPVEDGKDPQWIGSYTGAACQVLINTSREQAVIIPCGSETPGCVAFRLFGSASASSELPWSIKDSLSVTMNYKFTPLDESKLEEPEAEVETPEEAETAAEAEEADAGEEIPEADASLPKTDAVEEPVEEEPAAPEAKEDAVPELEEDAAAPEPETPPVAEREAEPVPNEEERPYARQPEPITAPSPVDVDQPGVSESEKDDELDTDVIIEPEYEEISTYPAQDEDGYIWLKQETPSEAGSDSELDNTDIGSPLDSPPDEDGGTEDDGIIWLD